MSAGKVLERTRAFGEVISAQAIFNVGHGEVVTVECFLDVSEWDILLNSIARRSHFKGKYCAFSNDDLNRVVVVRINSPELASYVRNRLKESVF